MSEHDAHSSFIKTPQQLIVVIVLSFVVPIVFILLLVDLVLNRPGADPGALAAQAVTKRIQPVGRFEVGESAPAAAAPMASAATPAAKAGPADGAKVYQAACVACHAAGVANAPKLGDKAAWASRVPAGVDALVQAVIKGKGAMPPKAGNPGLSDSEIKAAVEYMLAQIK